MHYSAMIISLNRFQGVDSRRMTGKVGWKLPYTLPSGIKVTTTADLHGDLYWVNNLWRTGADKYSGVVGRLYPQAKVDVRYPFVREYGNVRQVVEPRVALVAAPSGLNSSKIPNEDSVDFEFDDANLFAANRYPGEDRIDDGIRLVYGVSTSFFGNRGGVTELFVGQSLRLTGGRSFGTGSGLDDDLSDVVGRVRISPASYMNMVYRFRFDAKNFKARRNEVSLNAGVPALNLSVNYLYFATTQNTPEFPSREEISFSVKSQVTKRWSVFGGARWDLADAGILNWQMGGEFKNECCAVRATYLRTFTQDRDVRPTNRFLIRIVLKHLGEVSTGR
jgi:LPS-assembly protein